MSDRKTAAMERSQSVFSANWKEDVLLHKRLKEIETSKRRVVHSIAIDQRVANKRFQQKLYRSRLAYARLTGNREKLKDLLFKDGYRFNTNVCGDDDYTVKLPTANKRASSAPPLRYQVYGPKKNNNALSMRESLAPTPVSNPHAKTIDIDNLLMNTRDSRKSTRPKSSVSIASKSVKIRPATAVPDSSRTKTNGHVIDDETDIVDTEMYTDDDDFDEYAGEIDNRPVSPVKHTRFKIDNPSSSRPKTAVGTVRATSTVTVPSQGVPRRPKSTNTVKSKAKVGLFDEEKQPTLLEIHREKIKAANYPQKVRTFLGTVRSLQSGEEVDYYTMRLEEDAGQGSKNKLTINCVESEAEKKDALRSIGDLNSRNLTMRTLNWDFLKTNSEEKELEDVNEEDVEMRDLDE